jgi:hypothetical protein
MKVNDKCCKCHKKVFQGFMVAPHRLKCRDCIEEDNHMTFEEFLNAEEDE